MATAIRKQREIQEREQLILDVAREMLLDVGYIGLTMDRIAEKTEYSKGTIYGHFPNKEEVVAALAVQLMEKRTDFFARAAAFKGKSRERMVSLGLGLEIFVRLFPLDFRATEDIMLSSVREKTSPERQRALQASDNRCMNIATGIVRDGISQGDLVLPEDIKPEHVTFGLYSLHFGAYSLMGSDIPLAELGIDDPFEMIHHNSQSLLDGYGWQPLDSEWDYETTRTRVHEEVFSHEIRQLNSP